MLDTGPPTTYSVSAQLVKLFKVNRLSAKAVQRQHDDELFSAMGIGLPIIGSREQEALDHQINAHGWKII